MEVSAMVEIAVVVIDRNAKTSINCVRNGKLRRRVAAVINGPPGAGAQHPASGT
jgi:hypothetical protein